MVQKEMFVRTEGAERHADSTVWKAGRRLRCPGDKGREGERHELLNQAMSRGGGNYSKTEKGDLQKSYLNDRWTRTSQLQGADKGKSGGR